MKISYQEIEPLIVSQEMTEYQMVVSFKASNSPKIIQSSANIKRGSASSNQIESIVKDDVADHLQDVVRSLVGGIFGKGLTGRITTRVSERLMHDNRRKYTFTKEDKQDAVVEAFRRVASNFKYDENSHTWKLIEGLSEFDKKRLDSPITQNYDKEVLARMLIELAEAEEGISMAEQSFLVSYLDKSFGSIDELSLMEPLSAVELSEVSPAAKDTIFMLATAMVLVDERATAGEKSKLLSFASKFGFPTEKVNQLILNAKLFILEKAMYKVGHNRESLFAFADKIKLDREEAERFFVRFKKRTDLAE